MCLRVKKFLYACSWGMQALIFLCASNFEKVLMACCPFELRSRLLTNAPHRISSDSRCRLGLEGFGIEAAFQSEEMGGRRIGKLPSLVLGSRWADLPAKNKHRTQFLTLINWHICKDIEVVNGNGNGGKLSEIHELVDRHLSSFKQTDYFLDNTTGDLYGFNYENNEWIPKGNCGLHYRRSAQEFQSLGKYILKAPIYKAQTVHKEKYQLYRSRKYEETCQIKKIHLHVSIPQFLTIPLPNLPQRGSRFDQSRPRREEWLCPPPAWYQ